MRPAPYVPFSTDLIPDVVLVGNVLTSLTGYQNRGYALIPLNWPAPLFTPEMTIVCTGFAVRPISSAPKTRR
jgi:hypothetical protein